MADYLYLFQEGNPYFSQVSSVFYHKKLQNKQTNTNNSGKSFSKQNIKISIDICLKLTCAIKQQKIHINSILILI